MRNSHCFIAASLCIAAFSQAVAADTPSQTPAPAAAQAPATAAADADSAAAAQAKAEAQARADAEAKAKAIDKRLRAQGYKPVSSNGTVRYCRNEQALGSRFEHSVCGTPEELDFAEQNGKETVQRIQQNNSSTPSGK